MAGTDAPFQQSWRDAAPAARLTIISSSLVLFDFDGTLVNSFPGILEGYRYAFRKVLDLDYPANEEDLAVARVARFKDLCVEKAGSEEGGLELIEAFREHYFSEALETPVEPYEGIPEALAEMTADGIEIGIVTNKTRLGLEVDLERTGLGKLPFAAYVSAEDSHERKPHPRPLQIGLERAGAGPGHSLYVGDGPHDVEAANAAGMRGIGVEWGEFSRDSLLAAAPFAVAARPSELPGLVREGVAAGADAPRS